MPGVFGIGSKKKSNEHDLLRQSRQGVSVAKTTLQIGKELQSKNPHMALGRMLLGGMKLADSGAFYNEHSSPLELAAELKKLGIRALAWEPETLMAEIDRKYRSWTAERVHEALDRFHRTGVIDSEVPTLVRNKLYAIRLVATTDSPHSEWNVFEKVGGAFNDRVPQFGLNEPLSALECAKTVALIENIRPDSYTNEIKIYIAACCYSDGLYTVAPIKWLNMADQSLQQMIYEETGERPHPTTRQQIATRYQEILNGHGSLEVVEDDIVSVQAHRLSAIEKAVEGVL